MRKLIILIVLFGVLVAGAYGGRKVYRQWKTQRAVAQAREALVKSDYNNAGLWLRKAISADNRNLEAVRLMGDLTDLLQLPEAAVFWRNRMVELEPESLTNRLILARTALAYKDYASAKKALDGVDDFGRKLADFHKLTGAMAVATGSFQDAEIHFQEAMRLEPNNPVPRLNLAMLLTQRADPEMADQGRRMLEAVRSNPVVRADALRHLARDALRRTNHARAIALASELVRDTNSVSSDRLLQLDVLLASRNPQLPVALGNLQRETTTNAAEVFAVSRWMLGSLGPADTLRWLETHPSQIRTNLPVTMAVADAYLALKDWLALQRHVGEQQWGDLEYLRFVYRCRALREQNLETASKADWSKAVKATEGRFDRIVALQRVVAGWRWFPELEELLWIVVNRFPTQKVAVQSLSNLLFAGGKTRSLLTLYALEAQREPNNLAVKNNLAAVALLLDAMEHKPHELAREVYEKQKTNSTYASTYAYSLHVQKKTADGLRVLSQLKPEELERPAIAGFYGLMLTAVGEKAKAQKYMNLSSKAPLLPEERELFRRVKL